MFVRHLKVEMRPVVEAILRRLARSQWCRHCGVLVEMISARDAANLTGTSLFNIYRQAEAGKLHFLNSREGTLIICANSLPLDEQTTQEIDPAIAPLGVGHHVQVVLVRISRIEFHPDAFKARGKRESGGEIRIDRTIGIA